MAVSPPKPRSSKSILGALQGKEGAAKEEPEMKAKMKLEDWSSVMDFPFVRLHLTQWFSIPLGFIHYKGDPIYIEHIVNGRSQWPASLDSKVSVWWRLEARKTLGPEAGECGKKQTRNKWKGWLQQLAEVGSSKRWGLGLSEKEGKVDTLRKSSLGE